MNFFYKYETKYEPLSITNASMPALSDYVGSVNDALVHIDEYQNAIDNRKVQWLKDLWNGIGRTKMNMEKDKKLVQAKVDSGIILTGQEMPTADIALFTRIIYLTFDKGEHTREEKMNFAKLERYRQIGATHITLQLLKHREQFQAAFGLAWKKASEDLENALENDNILDRIMTNWTVLMASYIAIRDYIEFPLLMMTCCQLSSQTSNGRTQCVILPMRWLGSGISSMLQSRWESCARTRTSKSNWSVTCQPTRRSWTTGHSRRTSS